MDKYKNLLKVIAIQDLILANPKNQSVSVDFLSNLSQRLHLNRGVTAFLRKLTDAALDVSCQDAEAINASLPLVVERLVRILSMSASKTVPLRAIFKVWRELGLPDDFEDSVISANSSVFQLCDADELNTRMLKLVCDVPSNGFRAAIEDWRVVECCKEDCSVNSMEMLCIVSNTGIHQGCG
ncbi:unnamed protein product [Trifolium pratense]|nr:unnamed protein product [Trifolium pratense]